MTVIQLIKLEYLKYRKNAVIQLLFAFFAVMTFVAIFAGKRFFDFPPPFPSKAEFFVFPTVWDYQGYIGSWLIFALLGYAVIYMVTRDVAFKVMRQNIITGLTHREFFLAKVYTIVVLALVATLLYVVATLTIGVAHTEGVSMMKVLPGEWRPLRYFLMCLGYMSFALLVAMWLRKGGLSIFFYFTYIIVIESILKWGVSMYLVSKLGLSTNYINYWPLNVFEDLHPSPWMRIPEATMQFGFVKELSGYSLLVPYGEAMVLSVVYTLLFVALAWFLFSRGDV